MIRYNVIIDKPAKDKEVFENLKEGGLKLICKSLDNGRLSQVSWVPDGSIEIITLQKNRKSVYSHYYMSFPYNSLESLKLNTSLFKNNEWYFGYISD